MMRFFARRRFPVEIDELIAKEEGELLIDDGDPDPILFSDRLDSAEMVPLTPVLTPRRGGWHDPCPICGDEFTNDDRIRRVRYANGTRPYVHARHLERHEETPEQCRHGLAPGSCSWCNGTDTHVGASLSRAFPARRAGVCLLCGERFGVGTVIVKASTPNGVGWVHGSHRA